MRGGFVTEAELYDKVMPTKEMVKRYVKDGDVICNSNFISSPSFAIMHEMIRQKKRNLTYFSHSDIIAGDLLIRGGCIKKWMSSYTYRGSTSTFKHPLEELMQKGQIEWDDYSNMLATARLLAAAWGLPFFPVNKAVMHSDLFNKRGCEGDMKFKVIDNPFNPGEKIPLIPPLKPDVSFIHAQRADKEGNVQLWGGIGPMMYSALASDTIIATVEEFVPHNVILLSPHHTIIPKFRTTAICEEPWGGHPWDVVGYYDSDIMMLLLWWTSLEGQLKWLDEWVYGVEDRREYIKHYIEKFGYKQLEALKARSLPSASVNYGSSFRNSYEDYEFLGITREQVWNSPNLIEVEVEEERSRGNEEES